MPPRVSVIVSTYNRAGYLREALASVRAQTYTDWECIVADDGSTDGTEAQMRSLAAHDPRLVYVRLPNGGRPGRTRNAGVASARGELLAFLDDDDLWLPRKLELQVEVLDQEPGVQLTFGLVERFGAETGSWPTRPVPARPTLDDLLRDNFIPCSSVVCRRAAFLEAGSFSEEFRIVQDYELWLRIAWAGPIAAVPAVLCRYRVHEAGISKNTLLELRELSRLCRKLEAEWRLAPASLRRARKRIRRRRARALAAAVVGYLRR